MNTSPALSHTMRVEQLQNLWQEARALHTAGQVRQAEALYRQILSEAPGHPAALNALGMSMSEQGRTLEALQYFNAAIKADPKNENPYLNMGHLFYLMQQFENAAICYRQLLQLYPGHRKARRSLAMVLKSGNQTADAAKLYQELADNDPADPILALERANIGPVIFHDTDEIERWRADYVKQLETLPVIDIARHLPQITMSMAAPNFGITYHGQPNRAIREAYASRFVSSYLSYFPLSEEKPWRIGFHVDQNRHGVFLNIMGGVLEKWDADDMTPVVLCNTVTLEHLRKAITNPRVHYFILPDPLTGAIQGMREARLDLCYYWEVGTSTASYFLAQLRAAPIQVTGWGSVETTGLSQIDYFLSSEPQESEGSDALYTEPLVRFKHLPAWYARPNESAYMPLSRAEMKLDPSATLYLCPQQLLKIHPGMDALFADILRQDQHAHILLFAHNTKAVTDALLNRLKANITVGAERILMYPQQKFADYLRLIGSADVMLDTLHYGGGQTTLDALFIGLPVITLPGPSMRGGSTAACYRQIGVMDTIAKDMDEYVRKAVHFANDRAANQAFRENARMAAASLYENDAVVDEHTQFFRDAITRYREGLEP